MFELILFVGALAVAYSVPGPDMIFILQVATTRGASPAIVGAVGLASARACHVLLAAVGLAALFRAVPWSFDVVRFGGALYLAWIGVEILRAQTLIPHHDNVDTHNAAPKARFLLRGFLTNLLNPKPLLFCSVLVPQFIKSGAGSIAWQFFYLGTILVIVGLFFDSIFAVSGSFLARRLSEHPFVQSLQRYAFAALLIGFGANLTFLHGP